MMRFVPILLATLSVLPRHSRHGPVAGRHIRKGSFSRLRPVRPKNRRPPLCYCEARAEVSGLCRASNWTEITAYPAATLELLYALRVCGECLNGAADFVRIGDSTQTHSGPSDGGYVMCDSSLRAAGAAISVGIESRDGWGTQLAVDYRLPVDQYDCTHEAPKCEIKGRGLLLPWKCGNLTRFHARCVEAASNPAAMKLKRTARLSEMAAAALARSRPTPGRRPALVLKIDPEGAELGALDAAGAEGVLASFTSIAVEFHRIGSAHAPCHRATAEDPNGVAVQQFHPLVAATLRTLLRHFRVVHVHGNNFHAVSAFGPYRVSPVVEMTLVRKDLSRPIPCANSKLIRIDEPNAPFPEHVQFVLPGAAV